jgi:HSP20 family molecular chaperone IbpA
MSSFLNRLKDKKVIPTTPEDDKKEKLLTQVKTATPADGGAPAEQLKVDIFQTTNAIIVYAQIAGAGINDYGVTIDGEGDTITIKGQRTRPNGEQFQHPDLDLKEKEHVLEECSWGSFYRQIILPAEVDADKTEAKMREGVLMLLLPLKGTESKGVKIQITEVK